MSCDCKDKFGTSILSVFSLGTWFTENRGKINVNISILQQFSLFHLLLLFILFLFIFLPLLKKEHVKAYIKLGVCTEFSFLLGIKF